MRRALVLSFVTLMALHSMAFECQSNAGDHARREHLASKLDDGVLLLFAATAAVGQNALHGYRQADDFVKDDGSLDCLSCGAPKKSDEFEKAMAAKR
jgi:hypothetical protein